MCAMKAFKLNNGLKCLFEQRKGTGVVAIQVWVKVGSKYEADRQAGITHFIEHLIFKGSGEAEGYEIAPKIEALGGNINAFTSYDNTVYHIVVPEDAFETGLELLVGAVKSPRFPDKEIAKEKKVIIEEIKMGEDHPQRKLFKELFSLSYEGHPYGRPIIGFEQTVSSTERPDIMAYFNEHYTIDNMVVVVIGDFDEAKGKKLLEEGFSGLGARPVASQPARAFPIRQKRKENTDREGCERELPRALLSCPSVGSQRYSCVGGPGQDIGRRRQFAPPGGAQAQEGACYKRGHVPFYSEGRWSLYRPGHVQRGRP